jgi:hypothetical protein
VFLFEAPSGSPAGRLDVSLGRDVLPELPSIKEYGPAEVVVRLLDCPYRKKGAVYRLEAWIDGPFPGAENPPPYFHRQLLDETDPGPEKEELDEKPLRLAEFSPVPDKDESRELAGGLHRLQVSLTVDAERNGVIIPTAYTAVRYFLVEPRNVVVLQAADAAGAALGGWAAHDWALLNPDRVPASAGVLFGKYLRDKVEKGLGDLRWRDDLWESNVVTLPLPAGDAFPDAGRTRLLEELKHSRALVLVDPTLKQLALLDAAVRQSGDGLAERVRQGLTVLVVGPPAPPAAPGGAPWPEWLPCAARPAEPPPGSAGQPQPLRVHRDRRLYFCLDCSRLMDVSTPADQTRETPGFYTPLQAQADLVNGLCGLLNARADKAPGTDLLTVVAAGAGRRLAVAGPPSPRRGRLPGGEAVAVETPVVHFAPSRTTRILRIAIRCWARFGRPRRRTCRCAFSR